MMKIFLDDERDTPDGWVRCYWPDEVIELLHTERVTDISLDHDLGDDQRGTGYDVLLWIEEAVADRGWSPPTLHVHSANPSAVEKMLAAVDQIQKLSAQHSDYYSHCDDGQFLISWDGNKPAWFAPDDGEPVRLEISAEVGLFLRLADGNILGVNQSWQCYRQEFLTAGWRRPLTPQPMSIWNADSGARRHDLIGHHIGAVIGAELLDDRRLLTWGRDYLVRVWDYQSGECLDVLPLPLWPSPDDQQAVVSSSRFSSLPRLEKIQYVEQRHFLAPNVQVDWIVAPGQKQHSWRCNVEKTSGELPVSPWVPNWVEPAPHRICELEGVEAGYSTWFIDHSGRLIGGGTTHGTTGYFYAWDGFLDLRILIAGALSMDKELREPQEPDTVLIQQRGESDASELFCFRL